MSSLKDSAVVLRRLDFSESSQVLAVFTREHGKVRLIAKGIKRSSRTRFAPAIDLLDVGQLELAVRTPRQEALAILTEWKQTTAFSGLRDRLDRLYGAQYAAGLVADLTEDWDPHPELFQTLVELFADLAFGPVTLPSVVRFQRLLLTQIGALPIFAYCVGCGRGLAAQGDLHFSSFEGGVLCRDCESARPEKAGLPRAALAWLQGAAGAADAGAAAAFRVFHYHICHLRGRPDPLGEQFLSSRR